MNVLITGAHGKVGTAITDYLGDDPDYDFTLLDVEKPSGQYDGDPPGEVVVADVRDYESIRPHVAEQDAVIHLALVPGTGGPSDRDLSWDQPLADNLEGLHNVAKATADAGVDSLLFGSSNHAVGLVEVEHAPDCYYGDEVLAGHDEPHRPDSTYGLTKTYGEDLGRLLAEVHGVSFYALRIGAVRSREYDHPYGDAERGADEGRWQRGSAEYEEQAERMKRHWQSRRDLAHMVECCLRDDSVEWDHFYGLSANEDRWLDDLDHARETIGYEPVDDGSEWDAPPE